MNLNDLNIHFSHFPFSLGPCVKATTLESISGLPLPQCSLIEFSDVTDDDFKKSIFAITSSAVGPEDLLQNDFSYRSFITSCSHSHFQSLFYILLLFV